MDWACSTQAGNSAGKKKIGYADQLPTKRKGQVEEDWMDVVKIDIKKYNLFENLIQDRL